MLNLRGQGFTLSPQEQRVLACRHLGLGNKQAAAYLHLSPHTLKTYLGRCVLKCAAESITQAVFHVRESPNIYYVMRIFRFTIADYVARNGSPMYGTCNWDKEEYAPTDAKTNPAGQTSKKP